jgi:glycosyltransferase involved in cell wall biosynthesis
VKISVVICSWNRERLLQNALESLCSAHPLKRFSWQVVVVLNNCTDNSQSVVEQFENRLPILCKTERRPGLSRARNTAIDAVSGDVMIWIDDDVRVSREWLRAYEQAFLEWPEASIFGGPILPEFEGRAPLWLEDNWEVCSSAFAARRVPPEADAPIVLDYLPFGANFAVRTCVQRQFYFDVRLGRRPGVSWCGGEEAEVLHAILESGRSGRWVRSASVHHVMPQERQTIAYLRAYYEADGRTLGFKSRLEHPRSLTATCLRDLCVAIRMEARFRVLRPLARPGRWIKSLEEAAFTRGWWIGRYWPSN